MKQHKDGIIAESLNDAIYAVAKLKYPVYIYPCWVLSDLAVKYKLCLLLENKTGLMEKLKRSLKASPTDELLVTKTKLYEVVDDSPQAS